MATLALKSGAGQLEQLSRLLEPFPGRLEFAVRVAAICALTALVVEIYQTPDAALTTYVVFFLNKPDRVTSLILSVAMMLMMTLIIGVVFLVAMVIINYCLLARSQHDYTFIRFPLWRRRAGRCPSRRPSPLSRPTPSICSGAFQAASSPRAGCYMLSFIKSGGSVDRRQPFVFAPSPRALCERELARRLRLAAAMLRAPDGGTAGGIHQMSTRSQWRNREAAEARSRRKNRVVREIEALRRAAASSFEIISLIDVAENDRHAALPRALRGRISFVLNSSARKSQTGESAVKVDFEDAVAGESPLSPLAVEVVSHMKAAIAAFREAEPKSSAHEQRSHDASRSRGEEIERFLFAGRLHESGSRPLRAQDHRGRDVLLCFLTRRPGLARHSHLLSHLLHRLP